MFIKRNQNHRAHLLTDSSHPKPPLLQDASEGKTLQKLHLRQCELQQRQVVHQKSHLLRAKAEKHTYTLSNRAYEDSPHISTVSHTGVIEPNIKPYQASYDQNQQSCEICFGDLVCRVLWVLGINGVRRCYRGTWEYYILSGTDHRQKDSWGIDHVNRQQHQRSQS